MNGKGFAPLYEAVISNNEMVVSKMLELGKVNANAHPLGGHSVLHVALRLCHFMMCVLLLMAGADPNAMREGDDENGSNVMVRCIPHAFSYLQQSYSFHCSRTVCIQVAHPYRHLVSLLLAAGAKPPYNAMDFGYEPRECSYSGAVAAAEVQPRTQAAAYTRTTNIVQKLLDMQLGSALFEFLSTATLMHLRCVCRSLRDAPQSVIHCPNARALYRVSRYCGDAAIQRLVAALPNLAALRLAGCSLITDRTMQRLAESPTLAASLVHLNLFNCVGITDEGVGYLGKLSRLQYLCLGWCVRITNRGIQTFVRNIVNSHSEAAGGASDLQLRTLILSKCDNLTDGMLSSLCQVTSLCELHLSWCPFISSIGLSHCLDALPLLTHLFVTNCDGIDLSAKIRLGYQFPNLLIDSILDSRRS